MNENPVNPLPENGRSQYQHQSLTLNNTVGMVIMSAFAISLLVALMRLQRCYHELVRKLVK